MKKITGIALACLVSSLALGQSKAPASPEAQIVALQKQLSNLQHSFDALDKGIDDLSWEQKVGDVAMVDKVILTGPPPAVIKNPTGQGSKNPVRFSAYVFMPRKLDPSKKYPLLVLPHGGVHSNFNTAYAHIVKELTAQETGVVQVTAEAFTN